MSNSTIRAILAIFCVFASGTATYADQPENTRKSVLLERQIEEVVSHLVGAMDTSAQANANPDAPNVRITTCKIKVNDAASLNRPQAFIYQEQALSQRLSQPYRQRFLRIAPSANNFSVESSVFKPPTPKAWIGLCGKPESARFLHGNLDNFSQII